MDRVFCGDCAFIRSGSDGWGGVYYNCKKAKVVSDIPNAIGHSITYEKNKDRNRSGSCKDYRHRRWYERFWANACG